MDKQEGHTMAKKAPREMTGAELKSMLKSSINFKSLGGVKCEGLKLEEEDLKWWRDAKVGMFVHWGLYSILGRGEWARFNENIPKEEYEGLAERFNPKGFSMSELTGLAKEFGANYMVLVSRHHDGFALWDSEGSYEGFTSAGTASGRDFVKEYVEAARKDGLRVGLYYSPMDWRFPGYFGNYNSEGWIKGKDVELIESRFPDFKITADSLRENAELMKKQCYAQVEELCSKYGPIDILWYDGGWLAHQGSDTSSAWFWEPVKLNQMVRSYNPKTVINPRSGWEGDFYCDEGSHEIKGGIIPVPWEKNMCVCSGTSWGWMADDPVSDFDWLIRMLVNVVCRDGNWLVNVGPDENGKLSKEVTDRMREIGAWLARYGRTVYGTRGGPIEPVDDVYGTTFRENTIYLHITDSMRFAGMTLPVSDYTVTQCGTMDGEPVSFTQDASGIRIVLPEGLTTTKEEPDVIIEMTTDRKIEFKKDSDIYFTGKE